MLLEIGDVLRTLKEIGMAAPVEVSRRHIAAVADAEQERARGSVGVFVQFAGRMDHERAWHDIDATLRCAHRPPAADAEIDLGRMRMAMIRADLSRLPAGDGVIAAGRSS